MKLLGVRIFWLALALLAAYVLFVMFVADVGGDEPAIPQPTAAPPGSTYWFDSSSNTSWPLS